MFANVLVTVVRRAGARAAPLRRMYTTRRFVDGAPGSVTSQSLTDNELRDFARDGYAHALPRNSGSCRMYVPACAAV